MQIACAISLNTTINKLLIVKPIVNTTNNGFDGAAERFFIRHGRLPVGAGPPSGLGPICGGVKFYAPTDGETPRNKDKCQLIGHENPGIGYFPWSVKNRGENES
jgi:hypothetical protein